MYVLDEYIIKTNEREIYEENTYFFTFFSLIRMKLHQLIGIIQQFNKENINI